MSLHRQRVLSSILAIGLLSGVAAQGAEFLNATPLTEKSYPISDAVKAGGFVFLSGKLGTLPGTPTLAPGGIQAEAKQAMENIQATLTRNGLSFKNIIKCTIYLADITELPQFNEVYRTYFPNFNFPTRSAVAVNGLALKARVEVECLAALD